MLGPKSDPSELQDQLYDPLIKLKSYTAGRYLKPRPPNGKRPTSMRSDMATDPHKVLRDAVQEAHRILAQYLEPRGPSCERTIRKLLGIFDGPAVLDALADPQRPRLPDQERAVRGLVDR
jgi:hypothetical protein